MHTVHTILDWLIVIPSLVVLPVMYGRQKRELARLEAAYTANLAKWRENDVNLRQQLRLADEAYFRLYQTGEVVA